MKQPTLSQVRRLKLGLERLRDFFDSTTVMVWESPHYQFRLFRRTDGKIHASFRHSRRPYYWVMEGGHSTVFDQDVTDFLWTKAILEHGDRRNSDED